jgi:hypothetical protein
MRRTIFTVISSLVLPLAFPLSGCMFMHMQRDPQTALLFPPTLSQTESGVKINESQIEGVNSDFQGALAGVTDSMKTNPTYLSMMGKYDAAMKRYEDDKAKWAELETWAQTAKKDPVKEDLDKLRSEGQAISTDLSSIAVAVRLLPGDLTRLQNAAQFAPPPAVVVSAKSAKK